MCAYSVRFVLIAMADPFVRSIASFRFTLLYRPLTDSSAIPPHLTPPLRLRVRSKPALTPLRLHRVSPIIFTSPMCPSSHHSYHIAADIVAVVRHSTACSVDRASLSYPPPDRVSAVCLFVCSFHSFLAACRRLNVSIPPPPAERL